MRLISLSESMHTDRANQLIFLIAIAAVILTVIPKVSAQDSQPSRKFDEFIGEVDYEDLLARLDGFAVALQNEPNAQGQIIVYRSRRDAPGISNKYARRAMDYLVKQRSIPRNRLVSVDGGMSGCLTYELWIVPPGSAPPARRFTYKYPLRNYSGARGKR
jgi:hypothetical protein